MRVFIAGVDGYLGWSLALYLAACGHEIAGGDLFLRRRWVEEALIPEIRWDGISGNQGS